MALTTNELFQSNAGRGSQERVEVTSVQPKKFATGSSTLARLTMVAFNTSTNLWVPWTNAGANDTGVAKGMVWPDEIVLDSSDEVLGQVMLRGKVHRDDVPLNSESQSNVDVELQTGMRELGIDVQGIERIR